MGRFLRSKHARAMLWYAAGGQCQSCGGALGEDWHGDHVIPWRVTHDTNVHTMAALCRRCNLKKGGTMWRSFQVEMRDIVQRIRSGDPMPPALYAAVTPGGGKSSLPSLLSLLIPQVADKLCWLAPRKALTFQGAASFENPLFRQMFGHVGRIRVSDNRQDPSRGTTGYTTTYNAVYEAPWLHKQEFQRHKYILVLDEPHHLWRDGENLGPYARAVQPLVEQAALSVFMSGTFERWDNKPIAYLPYRNVGGNNFELAFPDEWLVRYRRADALHEKAIVRLYFEGKQGSAHWVNSKGQDVHATSFTDDQVDTGQMLDVVLQTEYARQLLSDTVTHWQMHKRQWPQAKCLVVAPRIDVGKEYIKWLKTDHGIHAGIAHSHEPKEALDVIDRFKQPKGLEILVTVGMAYEGLDVPSITHLACLTRYRSKPWLEQCFSRACRAMSGKQGGYIFNPDDPLMQEVVMAIKREQEDYARETLLEGPCGGQRGPGEPKGGEEGDVVPLASEITTTRYYDFDQELDPIEQAELLAMQELHGLQGTHLLQLKKFAIDYATRTATLDEEEEPRIEEPDIVGLPLHQLELRFRAAIHTYTKRVDTHYHARSYGTTNGELYRMFGKGREDMSVEELRTVWVYLNERYPLHA